MPLPVIPGRFTRLLSPAEASAALRKGPRPKAPKKGARVPKTEPAPQPAADPGFFERQFNRLPEATRKKLKSAHEWQMKNHLGFGNLLNAGFWGYTIGSDLANGESIGGTAGSALGFMGGDALASRLIKPGKGFSRGAARMVAGMAGGLGGSMLGQHLGNTYAPIGRLAKPIEDTY